MAYHFYLDKLLLPVAPSKLEMKINNQNKQITHIGQGEINLLKSPKLTDISFEALLPQTRYPFTVYKDGFQPAQYYLDGLDRLKKQALPFQFIVVRFLPSGKMLFNTDMKVSLEDYRITEEAKNGFDVNVAVSLKQYRDYGAKVYNLSAFTVHTARPAVNSPAPKQDPAVHMVQKGDCLWNIARKYYGNGREYPKIYEANKEQVADPNRIYPGQNLIIPV